MNITKWSALQAGLFLAAKRLVRILTSFTTLGILGSALYGLLHGFWLMTAPPMTAPFWLVWPLTSPLWWMWTTRVSALVVIVSVAIIVIAVHREKQDRVSARNAQGADILVLLGRFFARAFVGALSLFLGTVVLFMAMYGFFFNFWLTSPPHTTPLWFVWTTRVSAIVMIVYYLWIMIMAGRAKLLADANCATGPEDSTGGRS